ncbi:MAG TPA: cytochrome c3 family protein [Edaphobacter sp.]|nr:cytochrome c3 family protein [Edaphobacter sp.]
MKILKNAIFIIGSLIVLIGLGAALIRWRGLNASSAPDPFEARLATAVRNFAIPPAERDKKNPVAGDPVALEHGRVAFLARCAFCHGIDGRGATPIGSNQYPRVPDLRADATQKLSDGDLHYIIEKGVRFTGMPSMPSQSSEKSWELVSYLRSIGSGASEVKATEEHVSSSAHYVGSESCRKCHASIYDRWKKTPMANVVLDPKVHADAIIPDLKTNNVAKFTVDQVAFVYGSKWKQRYFTRIGDDYYPLPVQWDIGNKKWLKYHVPDSGADWWAAYYPSDNMQRPTGPTCDGCHSVNYDIHTKQVAEWNVGCERCHGPGSEHVAHPLRTNILNPSEMDDVASDDTCIQCHSQGRPRAGLIDGKAYDWPVGYQVGSHLADYWKLDDVTFGKTDFLQFPDGTSHKNRMQGNDFIQSVMYRDGVTCASCHDVHGTENYAQLRKPADKLCLDCHGPGSPNGPHTATLEDHTHHKQGSAGSQCIACHMPKIEGEGVPGSFVRSHTFRFITPAMTVKYNMPNPCTSCHKDKSPDWATEQVMSWKTESPWRVSQ